MVQEIEEKIKSWTPKPMVDVSQITKLHMAKYTVESKVSLNKNIKFLLNPISMY